MDSDWDVMSYLSQMDSNWDIMSDWSRTFSRIFSCHYMLALALYLVIILYLTLKILVLEAMKTINKMMQPSKCSFHIQCIYYSTYLFFQTADCLICLFY